MKEEQNLCINKTQHHGKCKHLNGWKFTDMAMIWSTTQECGDDSILHVKIQASSFIDWQVDPKVHFKKCKLSLKRG